MSLPHPASMSLPRALLLALGALTLAACTVDNPYFGSQSHPADMGSPPDADTSTTCDVTGRTCVDNNAGTCTRNKFIVDRWCPSDSTCDSGHCLAPEEQAGSASGRDCEDDSDCADADPYTCQPFLVDGRVAFRCARQVGTGSSVIPCTSGKECLSGVCTARGTCFKPCVSPSGCLPIRGQTQTCQRVAISVDDRSTSAMSCVPDPAP